MAIRPHSELISVSLGRFPFRQYGVYYFGDLGTRNLAAPGAHKDFVIQCVLMPHMRNHRQAQRARIKFIRRRGTSCAPGILFACPLIYTRDLVG